LYVYIVVPFDDDVVDVSDTIHHEIDKEIDTIPLLTSHAEANQLLSSIYEGIYPCI
jgi:hypothetical protein